MMTRMVGLIAVVMVLCAWVPAALADRVEGKILSVGIGGSSRSPWGRYRENGWIPVHVQLTNHTTETLSVRVAVEQIDLDGDRVQSVSKPVVMQPTVEGGTADVWLYYWPRPDDDPQQTGFPSVQMLDDAGNILGHIGSPDAPQSEGGYGDGPPAPMPWIGKANYETGQSQRFVLVLGPKHIGLGQYLGARGGMCGVTTKFIDAPGEIPDRAIGLDGVDVLVWQMDDVHAADMNAGFQLKAIEEWVHAGGHLVITAGRSQEIKEGVFGAGFLPMEATASEDVLASGLLKGLFLNHNFGRQTVPHLVGKPVAGAVTPDLVNGSLKGLVVTHNVGAGTVTVITAGLGDVDLAENDPTKLIRDDQWLAAWQQLMGWNGLVTSWTRYQALLKDKNIQFTKSVMPVPLDNDVAEQIDFESQTAARLGMAALFLVFYFAAAGPGAALVLRYYKRSYWGWWIFGATVVMASGLAVLVVWTFKLERIDLKHETVVIGTANGNGDVSIIGYYGVFAPIEGQVQLKLPETGGLSYLAPFNGPLDAVQSYADPQDYELNNTAMLQPKIPFRSTLKKLQGRWQGQLKMGIDVAGVSVRGNKEAVDFRDPQALVTGTLVNHTGYALHDIRVVLPGNGLFGDARIPDAIAEISELKDGATFDLSKASLMPMKDSNANSLPLDAYLAKMADDYASNHASLTKYGGMGAGGGAGELDLLNVLLERADVPPITNFVEHAQGRPEYQRVLTRLFDRSANLRACRGLVIAHAGDGKVGVPSPLAVTVAGKEVRGSGEILFTWMINNP